MNISNSGLLIESDSALMPGNSVMFEFVDPNQELTRIWRLDTDLTVPAHLVRSEVSKIGPDRFRYRVAARFIHELELLADVPADWIDDPTAWEAYPSHAKTGSLGYRANRESVYEGRQSMNEAPFEDSTSLA